jgi:hypothetical protein
MLDPLLDADDDAVVAPPPEPALDCDEADEALAVTPTATPEPPVPGGPAAPSLPPHPPTIAESTPPKLATTRSPLRHRLPAVIPRPPTRSLAEKPLFTYHPSYGRE